MTRKIKSMLVSGGKKKARMTLATNSRVISGTPRMNSIKTTQIHFIIGIFDCRPSANAIPSGIDKLTAMVPNRRLSIKPPISRDGTTFKDRKASFQEIR